jgi:hypothetical protein
VDFSSAKFRLAFGENMADRAAAMEHICASGLKGAALARGGNQAGGGVARLDSEIDVIDLGGGDGAPIRRRMSRIGVFVAEFYLSACGLDCTEPFGSWRRRRRKRSK